MFTFWFVQNSGFTSALSPSCLLVSQTMTHRVRRNEDRSKTISYTAGLRAPKFGRSCCSGSRLSPDALSFQPYSLVWRFLVYAPVSYTRLRGSEEQVPIPAGAVFPAPRLVPGIRVVLNQCLLNCWLRSEGHGCGSF